MFPQFMCIGAQKSGTSWLDRNLRHHPDIWLPPAKELHHFDRLSCKPMALCLLYNRYGRIKLRRIAKGISRNAKMRQDIGWYLRYLFLPRSDKWYADLFSPSVGQIAGEITPAYAIVEEWVVRKIYTLMPNLKIIILLRNPIHRMWSQAAMDFSRLDHQGLDTIDEERIKKFLDFKKNKNRSDYLTMLHIWENIYSTEQIFIGFFEQLRDNPGQLLSDIYQFLDVDSSERYIPDTVQKKVNARDYPEIPAYFAHYLAQQHHEQLKLLHQRFDNSSTASWLELAEQYLKGANDDDGAIKHT